MRSLAMQALTNDYKIRYPGIVIGGVGDDAHKLHASDHNEDDTAGSLAAQSDADTTPEHRAIDVMLGPVFSRIQALATISEVLADPVDRARLRYVNFENTQWHMSTGFQPRDNSGDPHPTHIHFSGLASKDADATPWLGVDMYEQADRNTATADTWRLLTILENRPAAEFSIPGEAAPRRESNRLKEHLDRIEEMLGEEVPVTLTDAQLETIATKVADKLRAIRYVAETEE